MALKVELKPGERFILGESVITNGNHRSQIFIEGDAPVLREKDILTPDTADTPCKKVYLAIQLMYLSPDPEPMLQQYYQLAEDVRTAAPSTGPYIERMNNRILTGALYKALKEAKALIAYEVELLDHAQRSPGLSPDGEDNE
ncbi:MAG: flagellar biosynthesis repressor FlbT [Hyphomicrobiales bacterium]|nr:MAG: flagellar biosynthesis repressor FlbT [Hyphomicrobiales bacterium]